MPSIMTRHGLTLAAASMIVLAAAASASAQSAALANKATEVESIVSQARAGGANIIVEFSVPEFDIESDAGLAGQTNAVQSTQNAILQDTLGRTAGVSRMEISPMFATRATLAEIERLAADPRVVKIYPNTLHKPNLIQSVRKIGGHVLRADGGTGQGFIVAVIDTGVRRNHQFLQGKVLIGACFSGGGPGTTTCPNGTNKQVGAGAGEPCVTNGDGCEHGTHVAGIAAGNNTDPDAGEPRLGVAHRASLLAINVFTDDTPGCGLCAYNSDIQLGLEFVFKRRDTFGAKKIASVNMSLGGGGPFTANCNAASPHTGIINRLKNQNIATVIASGNNGLSFGQGFRDGVASPACISTAVTVGASDKSDVIGQFSNMGALVDLMAPGVDILSSVTPNGFASFNGTSMAAPHVAGAFAALRTLHSTATVDEITSALKSTGKPIADTRSGPDGIYTRRRIRLPQANDALGGEAEVANANAGAGAVISVEPANAAE